MSAAFCSTFTLVVWWRRAPSSLRSTKRSATTTWPFAPVAVRFTVSAFSVWRASVAPTSWPALSPPNVIPSVLAFTWPASAMSPLLLACSAISRAWIAPRLKIAVP